MTMIKKISLLQIRKSRNAYLQKQDQKHSRFNKKRENDAGYNLIRKNIQK